MSIVRCAARIGSTKVLGPGNRASVWVHGCCRNCPGCISEAFRNGPFLSFTADELAEWVLAQDVEGLTISGGEPMLQAEALAEMLGIIRERRDLSVIVYTGYLYEELIDLSMQDSGIRSFLEQIDLLIDGPYIKNRDRNQPYIGSDNQRLLLLTDRLKDSMEYYYSAEGRKIELHLSEAQTLMVGVPGEEQRKIWERIKRIHEY